jgi:hypothetical protein
MEKKERCVELRNGQGKTLFGLYIFDRETVPEDKPKAPDNPKPEKPETKRANPKKGEDKGGKRQPNDPPANGDPMTDPQKRYLFRLLADQGLEGDSAYKYLKDHFQVNSLKEITKLEASRVIDHLVTAAQGGDDARPPF